MGNDGGVIAVQRKFMRHGKRKAHEEKLDPELKRRKQTSSCALSDEPLKEPIVVCAYGNLYNKETLIRSLLDHSLPEALQHIESLKDVTTCKFFRGDEKGLRNEEEEFKAFCPITMAELNGKSPFVVLHSCGCVLSEKALRELKTSTCLVCGKEFDYKNDAIQLFPTKDQLHTIKQTVLQRKQALKAKKDAKKKKHKAEESSADAAISTSSFNSRDALTVKKNKVVQEAMKAIQDEKDKNSVFASIFNKNNDKKNPNDLLMTVGSLRYTLS